MHLAVQVSTEPSSFYDGITSINQGAFNNVPLKGELTLQKI